MASHTVVLSTDSDRVPRTPRAASRFSRRKRSSTNRTTAGASRSPDQVGSDMTWRLYQLGDTLEVIEPVELRDMVQGYQGGDMGVLP